MANTNQGFSQHNQIELGSIFLYRPNWTPSQYLDIKPQVLELLIFEDLFKPTITATLFMSDVLNLPDKFPMVGGELISITFRTPTYPDDVTRIFNIAYIGESYPAKDNTKSIKYNIELCTQDAYVASYTPISCGITGTYSDMIPKILAKLNSQTPLDADQSNGIVNYVAPYWNPLKICKYFGTRAFGAKFEPFIFYEDLDQYNFLSVDTLYNQDSVAKYFIEPMQTTELSKDVNKAFRTVWDWNYLPRNNKLMENSEGLLGGTYYTYDPRQNSLVKSTQNYSTAFGNGDTGLPVIDYYSLYDDVGTNRKTVSMFHAKSDASEQGAYIRKITFGLLNNYRLSIAVPGDSGMRVGSIIDLDIPTKMVLESGTEYVTSGRWLITSLKHIITPTTYSLVLEICKDSYAQNVPNIIK